MGKALKADVFIAAVRDSRFVIKDFGNKGFLERNLIGRIVVGRELRAYEALAGIGGLPSQYKRLGPYAIAVEYLEGRDLGTIDRGEIGPGVMKQFEAVVEELHGRGWVHLDLQRRSNILLVQGKIFVVDLASAFHPGGVPLIGRWLTRLFGFADRMSLIKMKSIYAPELLTDRERKLIRLRNLTMPHKW
jgi:tRNA A-37 threonylcarbamoyl transferase component Bud32